MIRTKCNACGKEVFLAETDDEQRYDPRATKYWHREKDDGKTPYCDAACALVAHFQRNKKEIPNWLIACQK